MASNYENAPACKLLATHCCACGRPLLDANSVEAGMGPDCRRHYMVGDHADQVARNRANFLVWEMALLISATAGSDANMDQVARVTVANNLHELRALGYDKLAAKLEAQWVQIKVTELPDGTYAVKMPYDERVVNLCRRVRGRRWDGRNKVNTFPVSARADLWDLLIKCFPGYAGIGPKGSFVVPDGVQRRLERAAESDQEPSDDVDRRVGPCAGCEECDGEGGHHRSVA